ncbi:hypothetical protein SALBM135S_10161 [Streptomyces alboniger]
MRAGPSSGDSWSHRAVARVSLETVQTHVGNVLTKLGAQNRVSDGVVYGTGLVVPGGPG